GRNRNALYAMCEVLLIDLFNDLFQMRVNVISNAMITPFCGLFRRIRQLGRILISVVYTGNG
ncbi:hypothetical protein, partial [Herminiimonas fonticola]|uniref:hypothetical protein n=1 Tax=Herminiimonas fonticola TaxID=303380 RepID=UPI00333F42ED